MTNAFGTQKLGEKLTEAPTTGLMPEVDAPFVLGRGSVGSGRDERFGPERAALMMERFTDEESLSLINVDKSLRQQSLLMTLDASSVLGPMDKAVRVRLAAAEGLLPHALHGEALRCTQIKSGGLFKDWEFDM